MTHKHLPKHWVQKASLLLVALIALSPFCFSQANFLSVFGNPSCSGCCSSNDRMTCLTTPSSSSFSSINTQTDGFYVHTGYSIRSQNSAYSSGGQLLFTTNGDGIYSPDGTQVFGFGIDPNTGLSYTLDYSVTCTIGGAYTASRQPNNAISEVVVFPVPNHCFSYYVAFWCELYNPSYPTGITEAVLRIVKVDITANFGNTSLSESTWYTFTDNLLTAPGCTGTGGSYEENYFPTNLGYSFEIAVDAENSDKTRDIYTINPAGTIGSPYSTLRQWHIDNVGTLPVNASTVLSTGTLATAYTTKAKIFTISSEKYFAYVSGTGTYGNKLTTYNLTNTAHYVSTYTAPVMSGSASGYQTIWGFEYLPSPKNVFCFCYDDEYFHDGTGALIPNGGLGYAAPVTSGTTSINAISSTDHYCYSDLELTKNGDMLLTYDDFSGNGSLSYLSSSSLTSSFTSSSPSILHGACTGSPNISVDSRQYRPADDAMRWYLGSQIRGENYSSWGATDLLNVVIPSGTSVTWTPSSNPVQAALGVSTVSTISAQHIVIEKGASLTISSGLTLEMASISSTNPAQGYIDINSSPFPSSYYGGHLTLDNATITRYANSCGSDNMWGGIRVWGEPLQSQSGIYTSRQGVVTTQNNSTISWAHTAVLVGQATYFGVPGGGGIIRALNTSFVNNNIGVEFFPYSNIVGGVEMNNASRITLCAFNSDDITSIPSHTLYDIAGFNVKGISIGGCSFTNGLGNTYPSYGIYGNMGFNVGGAYGTIYGLTPSTFNKFTYGIYHFLYSASYTPKINDCIFNGNFIGVNLSGSIAPVVVGNTFNVPYWYVPAIFPPYYATVRSVGLNLVSADKYIVNTNTFKVSGPYLYGPFSPNQTVGCLAWNTDHGNDNVIYNNSYSGLNIGNLSNYKNRNGNNYGLWYKCNGNTSNYMDIATYGNNTDVVLGDGIRNSQGLQPATGVPAANTFSVGYSNFNLYNLHTKCAPFYYLYSATAASIEIPGVPGTTAKDYDASITPVVISYSDNCTLPTTTYRYPLAGLGVAHPSSGYDAVYNDQIAINNMSYYMSDTDGIQHRDSVYYWASQLNNTSRDRITAYLLLEDGYADSAYALYSSIATSDTLDALDSVEYTKWGGLLFDVQSRIISQYATMNNIVKAAYGSSGNPDSVYQADSAFFNRPILSDGSLDTLVQVFDSSTHWSHILAEGILFQYNPDTAIAMTTLMPDSLLLPEVADSLMMMHWQPGVLAVTEISRGPSGESGCAYAEMIVANCGTDGSPYVDIGGWIIDDNSGNFDTGSCSVTGVTRGHYRLSPTATGWKNVPVGTVIVMYNADNNCYGLPSKFTIDSANYIMWIPIYTGTNYLDTAFMVERYEGLENADKGSYCSDTGVNVYADAQKWGSIADLSPVDAFQVRCPGCTSAHPGTPAFYHGFGYAPDTTYCFAPITSAAGSLGGAVQYNSSSYEKYVFDGSVAVDFGDATKWTAYSADKSGSLPATLGYVDSALYSMVLTHSLALPCCGDTGSGGASRGNNNPTKPSIKTVNQSQRGIHVFPNPATMTLYFEFPIAAEVTVRLTDILGRVMDEQVVRNGSQTSFDVHGYAPGLYLYQVITNGKTQSGKVLIGK